MLRAGDGGRVGGVRRGDCEGVCGDECGVASGVVEVAVLNLGCRSFDSGGK